MKMKKVFSVLTAELLCICLLYNTGYTTFAENEPTIAVSSVNAQAGEEVELSVSLANNPGICTALLSVHYADELTLIEVEDTGLLKGLVPGGTLTNNPYGLYWDDSLALSDNTGNGDIVKLTFKVSESAADGDYKVWITYAEGAVYNLAEEDQTFNTVDGIVQVRCQHVFGEYTSNHDATCTVDGTKTAICELCSVPNTITDEGTRLGHNFVGYTSNHDATCTVDGTKTATCSRCDAENTIVDENTKLGHSFSTYSYNNDATYLANGTETATCDREGCSETNVREKAGSKLVDANVPEGEIIVKSNIWKTFIHTISFGLFYKESIDVTVSGSDAETGVASIEYYVSSTSIAETSISSVTDWIEYAPFSLSENGKYIIYAKITDNANNVKYISSDGMVIDETMPVISGVTDGMTYCAEQTITVTDNNLDVVKVNNNPITLTDGKYQLVGNGSTYEIVATDKAGNAASVRVTVYANHSFTNYSSDENATCTVDGTKTATCERCDATNTITDENSKLGHSFVTYHADGNATCTTDGTKTATCERCDATNTIADENSKLGHSFVTYHADGNATCTTDGTKTATCERCDVTDTVDDADSALGHAWDGGTVTQEPTCTAEGERTYQCTRSGCGATETKALPKAAHEYTDTVVTPTCTEDGYTLHTCENCSDEYKDSYVDAAHVVEDWTVTKEATLTEEGEKTGECSVCHETITQATPQLVREVAPNNIQEQISSPVQTGAEPSVSGVGDTGFDENVIFVVKEVTNSMGESEKDELEQQFEESKTGSFGLSDGAELLALYDLNLLLQTYDANGDIVSETDYFPNGRIKITIPVPADLLDGYKDFSIIRYKDDGTTEILPCTLNADGTVSFETDGLSYYGIIGNKIPKVNTPPTGDNANTVLWIIVLAMSFCVATMTIWMRRKSIKDKRIK